MEGISISSMFGGAGSAGGSGSGVGSSGKRPRMIQAQERGPSWDKRKKAKTKKKGGRK